MFKQVSIRWKIIGGYIALALLTCVSGAISYRQITAIEAPLTKDIPQSIENIRKSSELDNYAQEIRYYDELLTQSARNYAFTEDTKWKDRYNAAVPELDRIIKAAIENGDDEDKTFFSSVDSANLALVDMEVRSQVDTDHGNTKDAIKILESKEYWDQKAIYSKGLQDYVHRRAAAKDSTIDGSTELLSQTTEQASRTVARTALLLVVMSIAVFTIALVAGGLLSNSILMSLRELTRTINQIAQGEFEKRATVYSKDEIGNLAAAFNSMAERLQESRKAIEEKTKALEEKKDNLATRVDELQKPEALMVGRELKMVELKKEVVRLEEEVERLKGGGAGSAA